jgi:hypothetical protein
MKSAKPQQPNTTSKISKLNRPSKNGGTKRADGYRVFRNQMRNPTKTKETTAEDEAAGATKALANAGGAERDPRVFLAAWRHLSSLRGTIPSLLLLRRMPLETVAHTTGINKPRPQRSLLRIQQHVEVPRVEVGAATAESKARAKEPELFRSRSIHSPP